MRRMRTHESGSACRPSNKTISKSVYRSMTSSANRSLFRQYVDCCVKRELVRYRLYLITSRVGIPILFPQQLQGEVLVLLPLFVDGWMRSGSRVRTGWPGTKRP